jgi:hypothetical protein
MPATLNPRVAGQSPTARLSFWTISRKTQPRPAVTMRQLLCGRSCAAGAVRQELCGRSCAAGAVRQELCGRDASRPAARFLWTGEPGTCTTGRTPVGTQFYPGRYEHGLDPYRIVRAATTDAVILRSGRFFASDRPRQEGRETSRYARNRRQCAAGMDSQPGSGSSPCRPLPQCPL